jgi:5-formyltetrahydrofolate cyclo-ligase
MSDVTRGARGLSRKPVDGKPLGTVDMLGSICLVPGLVFDGEGYRVGYGAGYYDEFLAYYPGDKVGLVRSVQVSSNPLPHDDHDVAVDVLVTEGSIWRCRRL